MGLRLCPNTKVFQYFANITASFTQGSHKIKEIVLTSNTKLNILNHDSKLDINTSLKNCYLR